MFDNFDILLYKLYSVTAAVFFLSVCTVCHTSTVSVYSAFNCSSLVFLTEFCPWASTKMAVHTARAWTWGCQSTRHTVNSSPGRLVTKRRSTHHKQTNKQTSKPYCRSSNYP